MRGQRPFPRGDGPDWLLSRLATRPPLLLLLVKVDLLATIDLKS